MRQRMKQSKQAPPNWGVMFDDGSVRTRWNGRTQLHRAIRARDMLREQYPEDNITLAYRRTPHAPWVRVTAEGHEL